MSKSTSGGIGIFGWIIICTVFYNIFLADDDEDQSTKVNDAKTSVVAEETISGKADQAFTEVKKAASKLLDEANRELKEFNEGNTDEASVERLTNEEIPVAEEDVVVVEQRRKEEPVEKKDKEENRYDTATVNDPYGKIENKY